MKKRFWIIAIILIVIVLFSAWKIFGPTVKQPEEKFFYIRTGWVYKDVISELKNKKIISNVFKSVYTAYIALLFVVTIPVVLLSFALQQNRLGPVRALARR